MESIIIIKSVIINFLNLYRCNFQSLPVSSMSKPLTLSLPSSSNVSAKQNVILVKKGGSGGFTPVQNQGNISLSGPGRVNQNN